MNVTHPNQWKISIRLKLSLFLGPAKVLYDRLGDEKRPVRSHACVQLLKFHVCAEVLSTLSRSLSFAFLPPAARHLPSAVNKLLEQQNALYLSARSPKAVPSRTIISNQTGNAISRPLPLRQKARARLCCPTKCIAISFGLYHFLSIFISPIF